MNLLKDYKILYNLTIIIIGFIRFWASIFSILYFKLCCSKRKRIVIIGPVHSQHIQNFLLKIGEVTNKKKINILLINSDPNSFTRSNQIASIIIDTSIYKLLGNSVSKEVWIQRIFLNAENSFNRLSIFFIKKIVFWFKPDHFWIHDLQTGGYLALSLFEVLKSLKVKTYAAVWGNDLFYFVDSQNHKRKLEVLLPKIDLLHIESARDIVIANNLGFKGEYLPISNITLTDLDKFDKYKSTSVSITKDIYILLKGSYYLRSNMFPLLYDLGKNHRFWKNKKILIVGPSIEDTFHFDKVKNQFGLQIQFLSNVPNHEYMNILKRSKYHLSMNLSDGIPNSALEAVYSDSIPVMSKFTGLYTSLSEGLKKVIFYDPSMECDFQILFEHLDKMEINQRHILLHELQGLFENVLYNDQIQESIALKLLN